MNEIGDWLAPAIAAIWLLTRVLPRLFRSRPDAAQEALREETEPPSKEPPTQWTPASSGKGHAEPPPPIEPR